MPEKKKKDESSKMNVKTFVRILFWWALTIPAGFGVAAALTAATLKAYDSGWPSHPTKKFI
jgi:phosphate/sulfate permease